MRIRAIVAYDGSGYGGFQYQKNAPSIQGELEQVLQRLTGTPIRVVGAGRTDAGVHAEGQVIAFDVEWRHSLGDLWRGMNALLPGQIAVLDLAEAEAHFHPRFDALGRWYRYTCYLAPHRNPLVGRFSLHVPQPLNWDALQQAAALLVGRHDFAAFGSPPYGETTIRDVIRSAWQIEGVWAYFDIEATAFLYRMVRMTVGTLLRVGQGRLTPAEFEQILVTRDRRRAGPAVAAQGLCLKAVLYAPPSSVPVQNQSQTI